MIYEREHFERLRSIIKHIKTNYIDQHGETGHAGYLYNLLLSETLAIKQNADKLFKGAFSKRIQLAKTLYHYYKNELNDFERRGTLVGQLFREVMTSCLFYHGETRPKHFEEAFKEGLKRRQAELLLQSKDKKLTRNPYLGQSKTKDKKET